MTYIVLRNCPPSLAYREGWWYQFDFENVESSATRAPYLAKTTFGATGRFETRDDGVRAEVYEPIEEASHADPR